MFKLEMKKSSVILFALLTAFLNIGLQAQESIYPGNESTDTLANNSKIKTGFWPVSDEDNLFSEKLSFSGFQATNELSLFNVLQGRISGLDISSSGDPGRNAQAIIRGQDILGNHSPLIVIDGVPQKSLDQFFNCYRDYTKEVRRLIPVSLTDIKSIEIIKDGSSASLYGTDGADGVILIETRKGGLKKIGITYEFNQSIIKKPSFMPMLNGDEYITYQQEAYHNAGLSTIPPEISYDRDYADFENYSANSDWLKAVTQTGFASNHFLNIYGGNKKNRYYGSFNYLDQKGTEIKTGFTRIANRFNYEHYFTEKLTLAFNLNYSNDNYDGNIAQGMESYGPTNVLDMAFIKAPNMSILDHNGFYPQAYFAPPVNYQGSDRDYFNPVRVAVKGNSTGSFQDFLSTGNIQYDFRKWLMFRETFTFSSSKALLRSYLAFPSSDIGDPALNPAHIDKSSNLGFEQFYNEFQTLVKIPFNDKKKHTLNASLTGIMQNGHYSAELNQSNQNIPKGSKNAAVTSIFYKLYDRYILNVNTRFETISSETEKNNLDKHYAISLAWRFKSENLFQRFEMLNNGIISAGWGYSDFRGQFYNLFNFPGYNNKSNFYNLVMELGLLKNRINFKTEYYYKELLVDEQFVTEPSSVLKLRNQGWEFMIDYVILQSNYLKWNLQANTAYNNQIITNAPDNINDSESSTLQNGKFIHYINENKSPGSIYGLIYEGVYSTDQDAVALDRDGNILYDGGGAPMFLSYTSDVGKYTFQGGDAKFRDVNHDGIIDENDVVYLGNSYPRFNGGISSTIQYKNLFLTCNFHYRAGYKIINRIAMNSEGLYARHNQSENVLNRWRVQGQQSPDMLPRAYLDHPANFIGSDHYVENGGFIRMNYINLSYELKSKFCQKLKIQQLLFSLSAQRVFTFSDYSGLDVETELNYNNFNSLNTDEIRIYPPVTYTFSIRITV